uniref:hypothetical protein n=1 Tax=Flavobacterium psychrophilum TaxID=96345 RepID=UPI00164CA503|nr:hypothetical protein [Flavobacterium psychrophilum]
MLNRLNTKCRTSPITVIAETKYLKPRNAMLELNPIARIDPRKKIIAQALCM